MHAQQIQLNVAEWIALALVAIGAINWGLVGLAEFVGGNFNVVGLLLGSSPTIEALVYVAVGLAGLYLVYFGFRMFGARSGESTEAMKSRPTSK